MRQFSIFSLDNPNTNFKCRSYERFHYDKNFQGYPHIHSYTEIFFVTEGKGYFHLKNKKVPISRGTVIINNSNIQHTEASSLDSELEYSCLSIDNLSIQKADSNEQTFFFDFSKDYEIIFYFIRKIEWEWIVREQFWQCALHTYFNNFILYILRGSNLLGVPTQNTDSPNPLADVHCHMTGYYAEDLTLDKLADMFCMNKYYLAHTFKKIYGAPLMHTLHQIRCETARNLLQNTSYSIGQVSIAVGYNSCSHFAKMYRKFYGETPSQTRQNFISKS